MHDAKSSNVRLFLLRVVALLIITIIIIAISSLTTYYLLNNKIETKLKSYEIKPATKLILTPTPSLVPYTKPSPMTPTTDLHSTISFKIIAQKEEFKEYGSGKVTITYYGDVSSENQEILDAAFKKIWGGKSAQGPGITIMKHDGNYAMGTSYAGGGYLYWFGVKSGQWTFFDEREVTNNKYSIVSCSFLDKYNFPLDFYISTKCS